MAPGGEGATRTPPGAPRGRRLQMVPGLPREPAACGRGRLLSSFRGAAVPPLAPARRHAPRRRRPRAPPAPRDSARPPPAVRPAAARPPAAARNRPSWPGCGRGDSRCTPARRAAACGAGAPHGGRCRRPGPLCPGRRGSALCAAARGRWGRGRGLRRPGEPGRDGAAPVPRSRDRMESPVRATQVPECGRGGGRWRLEGRGPSQSRGENLESGGRHTR